MSKAEKFTEWHKSRMGHDIGVILGIEAVNELTEENAKLSEERERLLHELCTIQNACIGEVAMGYKLDAEQIGSDISIATGMTNPELNELLKDQTNDK